MTASSPRKPLEAAPPVRTPRPARLTLLAAAALLAGLSGVAVALVAVWHALEAIAQRDYVGALLGLVAGLALYAAAVEALRIAVVAIHGNPNGARPDDARRDPSPPDLPPHDREFALTNEAGAASPGPPDTRGGSRRGQEALR